MILVVPKEVEDEVTTAMIAAARTDSTQACRKAVFGFFTGTPFATTPLVGRA